jgi:hypothetical protein
VVAYIALIIYRMPAVGEKQRTADTIVHIQAQKITMADVTGTNLPPQPYEPENDATVAGIDKNNNGIRDDVELAIFAKYPNSAKIRAAEFQYASELQLELTSVFNSDTWVEAAKHEGHGIDCLGDVAQIESDNDFTTYLHDSENWTKEVTNLVINTSKRKDQYNLIQGYQAAFATGTDISCDIDLNSLPN